MVNERESYIKEIMFDVKKELMEKYGIFLIENKELQLKVTKIAPELYYALPYLKEMILNDDLATLFYGNIWGLIMTDLHELREFMKADGLSNDMLYAVASIVALYEVALSFLATMLHGKPEIEEFIRAFIEKGKKNWKKVIEKMEKEIRGRKNVNK